MFKEFKKFITRGNVIDLAVGIIIGAAFNKIVTSLVNDVIMPVVSYITGFLGGGFNLEKWEIVLRKAPEGVEGAVDTVVRAGTFLSLIFDFLITGFAVFIIVKAINKFNETAAKLKADKPEEGKEAAPEPPKPEICPYCMSEVKPGATRCPFCTSVISKEAESGVK